MVKKKKKGRGRGTGYGVGWKSGRRQRCRMKYSIKVGLLGILRFEQILEGNEEFIISFLREGRVFQTQIVVGDPD